MIYLFGNVFFKGWHGVTVSLVCFILFLFSVWMVKWVMIWYMDMDIWIYGCAKAVISKAAFNAMMISLFKSQYNNNDNQEHF